MYIVRLYKEYDTNKNVGVKIVDETTMQFREVDWDTLTKIVRQNPHSIYNAEIDAYGKVRLKNLNPKHRIRYYNQHYIDNLIINQYCIITKTTLGKMDFIADSANGIHCGQNVSVGDIAAILGVEDIGKLKLYNAYIEVTANDYDIYVFKGDNYRKLPKLGEIAIENSLGDKWEFEIHSSGQDGVRLEFIERIEPVHEAEIPNGISFIGQFLGGVNYLKLPISVKELGDGCFEELDDLLKIEIGRGIKVIPYCCFKDSSLQRIEFSGFEEEIGDFAFATSDLNGAVVTSAFKIGREAFSQTDIKSLITTRAEEIGVCAFEYCSQLTRVKLDTKLKVIKGGAFRGCSKLEEIYIPQNVTHIGKHAFKDCNKLRLAKVPASCILGEDAFPKKCQIIRY